MKTKLFMFVVLVALTLSVYAQNTDEKPFKIGVGVLIGLPVGDAADIASLAFGFDALCEYAVAPEFGVTLSIGYLDWAKKSEFKDMEDVLGTKIKLGMIPVLVGGKYYFAEKIYGSAQLGISFSTESGGGSAFTFAPGVGMKLTDNIDLLLKYQSASKNGGNTSFIGLRAGISF